MAQLLALREFSGSPEVYDLDNLVLLQAYVLRLEIPVYEPFLVQIIDCGKYLKHDLRSILLTESGSLDNFIEKFAALQQVRNQIEVNIILVDLVQFDNILVIHLLKNVDLALEPLYLFWVVNLLFLYELYGSCKLSDLVDASADLTVRALTEFLLDFVSITKPTVLLLHKAYLRNFIHMCPTIH